MREANAPNSLNDAKPAIVFQRSRAVGAGFWKCRGRCILLEYGARHAFFSKLNCQRQTGGSATYDNHLKIDCCFRTGSHGKLFLLMSPMLPKKEKAALDQCGF